MMDAADEISQLVGPQKKSCVNVDGETQRHSLSLVAPIVSRALGDDGLLIEILLRAGFPTTLVYTALVCKRWYHHVSAPGFLRRFRERHPPRLLGFYIDGESVWSEVEVTTRFILMLPHPPELATVVHRVASHNFGPHKQIMDRRNGIVFTRRRRGSTLALEAHSLLYPERGMDTIPPFPTARDPGQQILGTVLSKEEESGDLSYLYVLAEWIRGANNFKMSVYMLQDGVWCMHASATDQILPPLTAPMAELVDSKIYMVATFSDEILVLDLTTSTLSRIPFPYGVKYHPFSTKLSRADDASGVYLTLVHVNGLQLRIWLHKGDNWLLVHTICLHEMSVKLRMLDHTIGHIGFPYLCQVGGNAEFVFLKVCGCMLYLDVMSRTLLKVHGTAENDRQYSVVYPFMMIWPPIFPALKDDPARFTFCPLEMLREGGYMDSMDVH